MSRINRNFCAFCANLGEEEHDHIFKDAAGLVLCPVLSQHVCDLCGATGIHAHTRKFCPLNATTRGDPTSVGMPRGVSYLQFMKEFQKCLNDMQ